MQVGVNYPWRDYGWDFGIAPPEWRETHARPRWCDDLDNHLDRFSALGISVVRWFVLADGLTYGTGAEAPRPAPDGGWTFDPPALSQRFLGDFEELLRHFAAARRSFPTPVQLLPVLIDFHFCRTGYPVAEEGWVKRGRGEAITDPARRECFLDGALEPLLRVSQEYREAIYAWELMNEPEWVTMGWHPHWWRTPPMDDASMRAFLEGGAGRVRRAGFRSTVGFALRKTLDLSGITSDIDQFHYYPGGQHLLWSPPAQDARPMVLGEFATAAADVWPELPGWNQTVLGRLRIAADYGYALALPWSYLSTDRHTAWSPDVERDIECFTFGRNCPGALAGP